VARAKKPRTDAEKLDAISGIVNDPEIRRRRVQRESFDKIRRVISGEPEPAIEVTSEPAEAVEEPEVAEVEAEEQPEPDAHKAPGAEGSRSW
jgi:hypothetical protein